MCQPPASSSIKAFSEREVAFRSCHAQEDNKIIVIKRGGSVIEISPANAGDKGDARPSGALGRPPGAGNSSPLWYTCLENPVDRGASWATVHRVANGRTQISG